MNDNQLVSNNEIVVNDSINNNLNDKQLVSNNEILVNDTLSAYVNKLRYQSV